MIAIINNNLDHPVPTTEFVYDWLTNDIIIKNKNITEWTEEIVDFLRSLEVIPITSIIVKHDDEVIHEYLDLNGKVKALSNDIILHEGTRVVESTYISIKLDS